jgi:mono/diheme cytochrome c family protein
MLLPLFAATVLLSSAAVLVAAGAPAVGLGGYATVAVMRGAQVAETGCSGCHAVALEAKSRNHDAPQFRVLARLYSAEALETKLEGIVADGHFEMPRVSLTEDEISDVSAYIASLELVEDRPRGTPVRARSVRSAPPIPRAGAF